MKYYLINVILNSIPFIHLIGLLRKTEPTPPVFNDTEALLQFRLLVVLAGQSLWGCGNQNQI